MTLKVGDFSRGLFIVSVFVILFIILITIFVKRAADVAVIYNIIIPEFV